MSKPTRVIAWISAIWGTLAFIFCFLPGDMDMPSPKQTVLTGVVAAASAIGGMGLLKRRPWGWWTLFLLIGVYAALAAIAMVCCLAIPSTGAKLGYPEGEWPDAGALLLGLLYVLLAAVLFLDRPATWSQTTVIAGSDAADH